MEFKRIVLSVTVALASGGCTNDEDESSKVTYAASGQLSGSCAPTKIFNGETCVAAVGPVVLLVGTDRQNKLKYSCTGTFLSKNAVLTAAHCNPQEAGAGFKLFAVVKNSLRDAGPIGVKVSKFVPHPGNKPNAAFGSLDVGVAHLAEDVTEAVTLPLLVSDQTKVGHGATLFGFGITEEQQLPLASGQSAIAPDAANVEVAEVNPVDVIFGSKTRGACPGDSGGPAVRDNGQGPGVIGVTSGGLSADCRQATLSVEELPTVLGGRVPPSQIAELQRQFPDGFPQDVYVNTQAPAVMEFLRAQVPDLEEI